MKARYVFAAIVAGAIATVVGYLIGIQVGFSGGVRAASRVCGVDPKDVAREIKRLASSPKSRNPRMGD